jgi:hypothetical protein
MATGFAIGLTSCGGPSATVSTTPASPAASPTASPTVALPPSASPSAAPVAPANPAAPASKAAPIEQATQKPAAAKPSQGVVKRITQGDLKCYVTLVDASGTSHDLGATFEACNNSAALNQTVKLTYRTVAVSDCQSNEPCGKTRQESLISNLEVAGAAARPASPDSQAFGNSAWTIVVSNLNSWSGTNNTGNLTYRGCDSQGQCIDLKGGTMSCRDGMCAMGWSNGDYRYSLKSPMSNPDRPASGATQLTVRQGDKVILKETLAAK